MTRSIALPGGAAIIPASLSGQALSHGAPQTIPLMNVDLGMYANCVVVPYSALEVKNSRMMLRGATKESLKNLPESKYSN